MDNKQEPNFQMQLAVIDREVDNSHINQRLMDGYINATSLCKACKKDFHDYYRLKATKEFLCELSSETGIPVSALIQVVKGGVPQFQGTWVHPQAAINLAQWASPRFAVLVSKWVFEWMQGNFSTSSNIPYHLKRYLLNRSKIPVGYFSAFNEIVYSLIAPLEDMGYTLPDRMVPDISEAKVFCRWLRETKHIDTDKFPTYTHEYSDGRKIPNVKLYPNELLPDFRAHFNDEWLLQRAQKYFSKKDASALPYLQKMILHLPKVSENKSISTGNNDDFDKWIDKILGYTIDED